MKVFGRDADENGPLDASRVYIKIAADFRPGQDIARFYYSTDNSSWQRACSGFKMMFDYRRLFMGTKSAIYNYATKSSGGYVDVATFDYKRID